VAAWADAIHPSDLFLSAITILEIEAGTLMLQRRDIAQGAMLRAWIDNKVLPSSPDGYCRSTQQLRRAVPVCMSPIHDPSATR